MTRNDLKNALTRAAAGDDIADAFAAWRAHHGIARTGDMTLSQWQIAYDLFILNGAAGPVTPAPHVTPETETETETETQEDQTPMQNPTHAPADLSRVLDGLALVLSDKALEPLKAGIAALSRDRETARSEAAQARHDKDLALIDAEALRAVQSVPTAPQAPGAIPHAKLAQTLTVADLIGGRTDLAKAVRVDVCDYQDAPRLDPNFLWPAETPHIFAAMRAGLNVALWGARGVGKSSLIRQVAAVTRRPHFEISFHAETSGSELFGTLGIDGDGMAWVPGDLLVAMTTPHAVVDLSEISASRPDLVMQLNAVLETSGRSIFVGGKRHHVHPTVTFFATSNDNGSGEAAARYAGVRAMNDATRSRFIWVELETPTAAQFAKMIHKATGLPQPAADILAGFEKAAETHVKQGKCEATPGPRAWYAFAKLSLAGLAADVAFSYAVENLGTSEDGAVWRQEFSANFPVGAYAAALAGKPAPSASVETPTRSGFTPVASDF
jgi:AAA domain (dynein-related subfamily)